MMESPWGYQIRLGMSPSHFESNSMILQELLKQRLGMVGSDLEIPLTCVDMAFSFILVKQ